MRAISAGRCQRVCVSASRSARALLNDPSVLFLDEPTSGLDPVASREVHGLIASLRERGVTIFLTTHRLEEAERLCHRVAILNTTLRMIGRPDELRDHLFSRSLDVRVRPPLEDPNAVLGGLPGVEGWEQAPSGYSLAVSTPRSPPRKWPERWSAPARTFCRSPSPATRWRTSISSSIDEDVEARRR